MQTWRRDFFVGGGWLLIFAGIIGFIWMTVFYVRSHRAEGSVVALLERPNTRGRSTYAPRVAFVTEGGQSVEFVEPLASWPPGYSVGDKVAVIYDQSALEQARVLDWRLYDFPMILAFIGAGWLLVGHYGR
jgi:Protein of unknown function (DUF3592)